MQDSIQKLSMNANSPKRNRASTRALQLMTTFLASLTGIMISRAVDHRPPGDMPSLFLALGLAASTLPKAIILWSEDDPRNLSNSDEFDQGSPEISAS